MMCSFLVWNVRGAAKKELGRHLKLLVVKYSIRLLVLVETRTSGLNCKRLLKTIGFNSYAIEEAQGFVGGIWWLWSSTHVSVDVVRQSTQFVHSRICIPGMRKFDFTSVYASPNEHTRLSLWEDLQQCNTNEPWLVAGDFNEIASVTEKKGGSPPDISKCEKFKSRLEDWRLEDLPTSGAFYTWKGPKWPHLPRVYKKLDRVCANASWRIDYHQADVSNLVRTCSDHNPMLIRISGQQNRWVPRPFRFVVDWLNHSQFPILMDSNWKRDCQINQMLGDFVWPLWQWNKDVYGNIFQKKTELLKRLEDL